MYAQQRKTHLKLSERVKQLVLLLGKLPWKGVQRHKLVDLVRAFGGGNCEKQTGNEG